MLATHRIGQLFAHDNAHTIVSYCRQSDGPLESWPNCSIRECMHDAWLSSKPIMFLINYTSNKLFLGTHAQERPSDHVMSACRTRCTAFARRPAQLRRQASRFTMLRLLALALCGDAVLQPHTTTVAESGSCEQAALFAIALHGQLRRTRDIAVVVSVLGPVWMLSRYKYS